MARPEVFGMFYDSSLFSFTKALEANWQIIWEEYQGIRNSLVDWYEKKLYDAGWQVFGLFDFPHGEAIAANTRRCPTTTSLVADEIKHHGAVGFSFLAPQTRIKPHQGYQGDFLRCHLGLSIPPGDCCLKVENEIRQWQTGKVLVFDDRAWHEAWNMTDSERVILLVDFIPDR